MIKVAYNNSGNIILWWFVHVTFGLVMALCNVLTGNKFCSPLKNEKTYFKSAAAGLPNKSAEAEKSK